jgi:hypothetical protein
VQNAFQAAWDEFATGMRAAGFSDDQLSSRLVYLAASASADDVAEGGGIAICEVARAPFSETRGAASAPLVCLWLLA